MDHGRGHGPSDPQGKSKLPPIKSKSGARKVRNGAGDPKGVEIVNFSQNLPRQEKKKGKKSEKNAASELKIQDAFTEDNRGNRGATHQKEAKDTRAG
jgi:hypothetical protein